MFTAVSQVLKTVLDTELEINKYLMVVGMN